MATRAPRSRIRLTAWLAVIFALLVFVAVAQVDDDAASSLQSTNFMSYAQVDQALAAREAELVTQAWLEYGSLVAAGAALAIAVLPHRQGDTTGTATPPRASLPGDRSRRCARRPR
jgi:hypothetical protein